MADNSTDDRIDDVAAGDLIDHDRGDGTQTYRVVHRDDTTRDDRPIVLVTLETNGGETFDVEYAAGTQVTRSLESKWESEQVGRKPDQS
jgi:hypothetical protein